MWRQRSATKQPHLRLLKTSCSRLVREAEVRCQLSCALMTILCLDMTPDDVPICAQLHFDIPTAIWSQTIATCGTRRTCQIELCGANTWGAQVNWIIRTRISADTPRPASGWFRGSGLFLHGTIRDVVRRFSAGAVSNLQIGGALTRIIYNGVVLSKFWCWASKHRELQKGATEGNAHKHWVIPFLKERNGPAYERCRSICLDRTNPQLDGYLVATHSTVWAVQPREGLP